MKKIIEYIKELFKIPESTKNKFNYRDILFFTKFIKSLWKLGTISIFITIIISALTSLTPLSGKIIIDFIIMKKSLVEVENLLQSLHLALLIEPIKHLFASLNLLIIVILLGSIIVGLIKIIQQFLMLRFQQEITFKIQTALFEHVLRFPLLLLRGKQVGYLMARISYDVGFLRYFFSRVIVQIITNIFHLFFSFAILFVLNVKLSLILLSVLPIYFSISYFFAMKIRAISYASQERRAEVSKDMQEILSGVETIKAHTSEKKEVQKISGKIRKVFNISLKSNFIS